MAAPALPHGISFWHPVCLISTWFGVGLIPYAPGTWASIAALPMAWFTIQYYGPWMLAALGCLLFFTGCISANAFALRTNKHDPSAVVIDEVAAQCLVLTIVPLTLGYYVAAFIAFRVTDILKPWPVSWADRSVGGGFGIMLDDILAGLYAWAFMYIVIQLLG